MANTLIGPTQGTAGTERRTNLLCWVSRGKRSLGTLTEEVIYLSEAGVLQVEKGWKVTQKEELTKAKAG